MVWRQEDSLDSTGQEDILEAFWMQSARAAKLLDAVAKLEPCVRGAFEIAPEFAMVAEILRILPTVDPGERRLEWLVGRGMAHLGQCTARRAGLIAEVFRGFLNLLPPFLRDAGIIAQGQGDGGLSHPERTSHIPLRHTQGERRLRFCFFGGARMGQNFVWFGNLELSWSLGIASVKTEGG